MNNASKAALANEITNVSNILAQKKALEKAIEIIDRKIKDYYTSVDRLKNCGLNDIENIKDYAKKIEESLTRVEAMVELKNEIICAHLND